MERKDKQGVPMTEKEKEELYYNIENIASVTDCTGLITTPPVSQEEAESYTDLYEIPQPSLEKYSQTPNRNKKPGDDQVEDSN